MCVLVRESMYFFRYDPLLYSALGSEAKSRGGSVYCDLRSGWDVAVKYQIQCLVKHGPGTLNPGLLIWLID